MGALRDLRAVGDETLLFRRGSGHWFRLPQPVARHAGRAETDGTPAGTHAVTRMAEALEALSEVFLARQTTETINPEIKAGG